MYTASIDDPASGVPISIKAHTQAALCLKVGLRIDETRRMIVNLFIPSSAAVSLIIFSFIVATSLTPFGMVVVPLLALAYLNGAPHWINPLSHILYLRKCMRAWERELERIDAPDTRMV
jgi:hypothetical protein